MEMVESTFGDEMIRKKWWKNHDLESNGVYTAVGTPIFHELVAMAITLSNETGLPVNALVEAFGNYLFGRFLELFPIRSLITKHRLNSLIQFTMLFM